MRELRAIRQIGFLWLGALLVGAVSYITISTGADDGDRNRLTHRASETDPIRAALDDIATLNVGKYDWPQWGGSRFRNNTPFGKNIPHEWDVGKPKQIWDRKSGKLIQNPRWQPTDLPKNIKWAARLGSQTYGNPVVANGKVYIGTNNGAGYLQRFPNVVDLGCLLCFDEKTGRFLWQHSSPKLPTGRVHDWPLQGVCSTPLVDGARLWFVTNRCEVVCLDTEGFFDGENDGMFQDEERENHDEADVVWKFDMMSRLGVSPHNMSTCSVLTADKMLFVCTSNGLDESHIRLPAPDAPSFLAMNRETGEVLWTDSSPGKNILHGQWASPSYGVFDGQPQVIFPGGDGWVYSFDPKGDSNGKAKLLWKFDANPKESKWILGGRGTRNNIIAFPTIYDGLVFIAVGQDPEHGEGEGHLWCIDPTKRGDVSQELAVYADTGQSITPRRIYAMNAWKALFRLDGQPPNSVRANLRKNKLAPAVRQEFERHNIELPADVTIQHQRSNRWTVGATIGNKQKRFRIQCSRHSVYVDRETNEIAVANPNSAVVWHYSHFDRDGDGKIGFEEQFHRSIGIPVIKDALLYIGDYSGLFHCVNAKTGKVYWTYDMFAACWGSALLVDGKVYVGDDDGDITIFKHGRQMKILNEINMKNAIYGTPIVSNNVLFIATKSKLYAIAAPKTAR